MKRRRKRYDAWTDSAVALTDAMVRGLIDLAQAIKRGAVQTTRTELRALVALCERNEWFMLAQAFQDAQRRKRR